MKFLLSLFLALCAWSAHAVQFEVGAGPGFAQPVGNGGWYQEGFPHTLNLRSKTFLIGVTDDFAPGWAWHAQYVNLGMFRSDAMAADRDEDYNPVTQACNPGCNLARYVGNGSANGFAATVERYTERDGWRFGAEAGPYLFKPIWRETVYNWKPSKEAEGMTIQANNPQNFRLGAVFGVSAGRGPWAVSLRRYLNKCTPSTDACLWRSVDTLMLTYKF